DGRPVARPMVVSPTSGSCRAAARTSSLKVSGATEKTITARAGGPADRQPHLTAAVDARPTAGNRPPERVLWSANDRSVVACRWAVEEGSPYDLGAARHLLREL